jgi:hypothetical protein
MVWMVRSQFPAETGSPFFDINFQTSSGIHSASYVIKKMGLFPQEAKQLENDNAHTFLYYAKV